MPRKPGYAVHLMHLEGQRVLLVGAGAVAAEKLTALLATGARLHIVAPDIGPDVEAVRDQVWRIDERRFAPGDITGARLVLTATDDRSVNRHVVDLARAEGILANAVDDPELCDFYVPATLRRGPTLVSVSSNGQSPLFAGRMRRFIEAALPGSIGEVGDLFVAMRRRGLKGVARRSSLLQALASPVLAGFVDRGQTERAADVIEDLVAHQKPFPAGSVAIVGAGPGDRDHLTLGALDRIQRADVVLHDALVPDALLSLIPPGVRVERVGRRVASAAPGPQLTRAQRLERVIEEARAGNRVVRLQGGDPLVFGCSGELVDRLTAEGIPFEIIGGVSSVLAAPAAAGIPLTQRGVARGFSVRTGHLRSGPVEEAPPPAEETVVLLMGLSNIDALLAGLVDEGRSPDTPAVAVSAASRPEERIVAATLDTLADAVRDAGLPSPTTVVVGEGARKALALAREVAA